MICTRCREEKDALLFYVDISKKTGYDSWCKTCRWVWRQVNADMLREHRQLRYWANPEKARADRRLDYYAHREENIAYATKWQKKNPERVRQAHRDWSRENKDVVNQYNRVRRTRVRGAETGLTTQQWGRLTLAFGGKCAYCDTDCPAPVADHLVPVVNGGGYVWGNIFPVCATCNGRKHFKSPVAFLGIRKYADLMVSCH